MNKFEEFNIKNQLLYKKPKVRNHIIKDLVSNYNSRVFCKYLNYIYLNNRFLHLLILDSHNQKEIIIRNFFICKSGQNNHMLLTGLIIQFKHLNMLK